MRAGWSGKCSPTRHVYTAMPVSWQTRLFSPSATSTLRRIVLSTRCPGTDVSRAAAAFSASRRSCGMSFSAHTYRCAAASSTAACRSVASSGTAGPPSEDDAFQERVAHHPVAPVRAAGDLAACVHAFERRPGVLVDDEAAVLVVEDGVREDLLGERVDAARAVAAQHVRERELRVVRADARRVEVDGGPSVGRLDALALLHLVEDRLADDVAGAERVGELLAVGVQQHGAVRARRLGDRVALHRLGPRAAVRVVLQRVEVARLRAEVERDLRHLAGRAGMVRRQLAALFRLAIAAAAGGEDDGGRLDDVLAAARAPGRLELEERRMVERRAAARLPRLAQPLGDRVAGAVADLEQTLARRAAAAGEAVAAVLPRELDAELLEPVDRRRRLRREDLDELHVRRLVRARPDVLRVLLGGVVLAEGGLDAALRLRGVAGLDRALRRERDAGSGLLGGDRGGEAGGPAADHEHVEPGCLRH